MTITELNTARYHGLNLTDVQLLLLLGEHGPMDMTWLAAQLGVCNATVTLAAKKLIAKHLLRRIDRRRGDRFLDNRVVMLDLCELGRVRIHQITGAFPEAAAASA
jgi:DNA-binding MarR family transcriptional regulator